MKLEQSPQENKNQRDAYLNPEEGKEKALDLSKILDKHKDKRVLVLGSPSSGKSTLLQHLPNCVDMDTVFDTMPEDLKRRVLHQENPFMFLNGDKKTVKYTERHFIKDDIESKDFLKQTSDELTEYINANLKIKPGTPVFGTNLIDSDIVIYLNISEEYLESRITSRNIKTHRHLQKDRVFAIKKLIEDDIQIAKQKGLEVVEFQIIT